MPIDRRAAMASLVLPALLTPLAALAQEWPGKTVTAVVPYVAGGGVDPVARIVGQKLAEIWKTSVVVENRAGASGTIGAGVVARAAPDGTTLLMSATAEVVINQHFMTRMAYDPDRDLKPVTLLVKLPFVLVARPDKPFSDLAGLIAHAKKNPGTVSYASSGPGTPQHLAGVLLEQLAGVSLLHVPFKGVAQAMTDIVSGQVDIGFVGLPTGLQQIQAGKLRGFGVTSLEASKAATDIAPLARTPGLEQFELIQWFGVFVPAGTPDATVNRIQNDIAAVLQMADVRDSLLKQGAEPSGMPVAAFRDFVKSESEKFKRIVKSARIEQ